MKKTFFTLISFLLTFPLFTSGQFVGPPGGSTFQGASNAQTLPNPLGPNGPADIGAFVLKALVVLGKVGAVIIVVCFVYCGFLFVAAQGNEEKITKAKRAFFYTVLGTVILLGAGILVELIKGTLSQI